MNESVHKLATAGIAGAAATAVSGIIIQGIVMPQSDVSDEMWSYPWSSGALVPVSLVFAVMHVLVFLGVLGFVRSRVAGTRRAARVGSVLALCGTAPLFFAELASILFADQRLDDAGPMIVGGVFGAGVVLTALGLLLAGSATLRAGRWTDWRRYVPLAAGIWTTALIGISFTEALPGGVGVYGLCLLVLFVAVRTQPAAVSPAPVTRAKVLS